MKPNHFNLKFRLWILLTVSATALQIGCNAPDPGRDTLKDQGVPLSHAAAGDPDLLNTGAEAKSLIFVILEESQPCSACHNQDSLDLTSQRQWINSGHGNPLAKAWTAVDWKNASGCQQCHSATGFVNYSRNPLGYDPKNNDFSYLTAAHKNNAGQWLDNGQTESLYCWACHVNHGKTVRKVMPKDANLTGKAFPDVATSNLCVNCHAGREGGISILNSTANFRNQVLIGGHYAASATVLFENGGYEYPTKNYTSSQLQHSQIGTSSVAAGGQNGPCVGCHMSGPEPHRWQVLEKGTQGQISGALTSVCASCHNGEKSLNEAVLNDNNKGFTSALEALRVQLAQKGFFYGETEPHFFTSAQAAISNGASVRNWGNETQGKANMGAAFNYNLLYHESGAFVHNPTYSKRLIYDSIDWLDDLSLNDSVAATLKAKPHLDTAYQNAALAYLLNRP